MDRALLSRIDEELGTSEVAELCFLCSDVVNRKRLEGIVDAKGLFMRLEEKGLLDNTSFLSQLLKTIHRVDLFNLLEDNSRQQEETDALPTLSVFREMLYQIHEDMTNENLEKMKYLLTDKLSRRQLEMSSTALDVFAEMEKMGMISKSNVFELYYLLEQIDFPLQLTVLSYMMDNHHPDMPATPAPDVSSHVSVDQLKPNNPSQRPFKEAPLPVCETQPSSGIDVDAHKGSISDETEYYRMTRNPRGLCVIINNENFTGETLKDRKGTAVDEKTLSSVFERFGLQIEVFSDLTAEKFKESIKVVAGRDFSDYDILVVCILTHGEVGCIYGTDEKKVLLRDVMEFFTNDKVPTLSGKPKVFFIQACQNETVQKETPEQQLPVEETEHWEGDCGKDQDNKGPAKADFLISMATVQHEKSFRHTVDGSIYIQELCKQLIKSAESSEMDDILAVLTRVNREVSKGVFLKQKQMPEPRYTLTKKLVFRYV